jgi:hypothetical protein
MSRPVRVDEASVAFVVDGEFADVDDRAARHAAAAR